MKIVILVTGGCVQDVHATEPVEVVLIDSDNLRGDLKSWAEIEEITKAALEGTTPQKF